MKSILAFGVVLMVAIATSEALPFLFGNYNLGLPLFGKSEGEKNKGYEEKNIYGLTPKGNDRHEDDKRIKDYHDVVKSKDYNGGKDILNHGLGDILGHIFGKDHQDDKKINNYHDVEKGKDYDGVKSTKDGGILGHIFGKDNDKDDKKIKGLHDVVKGKDYNGGKDIIHHGLGGILGLIFGKDHDDKKITGHYDDKTKDHNRKDDDHKEIKGHDDDKKIYEHHDSGKDKDHEGSKKANDGGNKDHHEADDKTRDHNRKDDKDHDKTEHHDNGIVKDKDGKDREGGKSHDEKSKGNSDKKHEPVYCPKPVAPQYGAFTGAKDNCEVNSIIYYSCQSGYVLQGATWNQCIYKQQAAVWAYPTPACIRSAY